MASGNKRAIFLAPDGLRTIAGTARIGDVELGSISRQIQARIDEIIELVFAEVVRSGYENALSGGIVITGGGSMLQNQMASAQTLLQQLPSELCCWQHNSMD